MLYTYLRKQETKGSMSMSQEKEFTGAMYVSQVKIPDALYLSQETRKAGTKEKLFPYPTGRSVSYIRISEKGKSGSYVDGSGRELTQAIYISQEKTPCGSYIDIAGRLG